MLWNMRSLVLVAGLCGIPLIALAASSDWPSYNRTLTSERFSSLDAINSKNVRGLEILCSYDVGEQTGFQSGLVEVDGALFATTEHDTFSIDPNTCRQNWRMHEDFKGGQLQVNRGVAWLDGRVYRGTADGRVLGYDAKTGARLWATTIADPAKGESVPASPIAWEGMVFIGNAGGDNKGVKGRMYALDAKDGHILWEFYMVPRGEGDFARGPNAPGTPRELGESWKGSHDVPVTGGATWTSYSLDPVSGLLYVPGGNPAPDFVSAPRPGDNLFTDSIVVLNAKTGAYERHFQLVKRDFHDWDASTAPVLFTSKGGRELIAEAPKDGHLHVIDLSERRELFSRPVTRVLNVDAPIDVSGTRFCPGSQGGAEWNGPAWIPQNNLLVTAEVDWCSTVRAASAESIASSPLSAPWSGSPDGFGKQDDIKDWGGYLTATDADTGERKWQVRTPFPLTSGVAPTAGGLVFVGDMGGNFYAFDSARGRKLWSSDLGGAVAGGVITYDTGNGQKVAVAAGMTSPIWPTPKVSAKIVVLGLRPRR
ncbi:MAG: PQQ-binding-like beta-propeller repeat protein [Rhodanobacteraceae bacterium]